MIYEDLITYLRANGLARVVDPLLHHALPSIYLTRRPVDEVLLAVGASKIGGTPDVPPDTPWPHWCGEPLAFIAQFWLADVAPYDVGGALPATGLLSFFYLATGEAPYDDPESWAALYLDVDRAALIRHQPPPALQDECRFRACSLEFATDLTLPSCDLNVVQNLGLTDEEAMAYRRVYNGLPGSPWYDRYGSFWNDRYEKPGHRLLGYPAPIECSPLIDAYLMSYPGALPPQSEWARHATSWRLLFQVDTDEETGMDWDGGGCIYYCIEDEALQTQEFGDVRLIVQAL